MTRSARRSPSAAWPVTLACLVGLLGSGCPSEEHHACAPGARGCPCSALGACDDGLVCSDNACLAPHVASVHVATPGARACEALLDAATSKIAAVSFGGDARGAFARRGDRVGVSMMSASDTDFTGTGVVVRWLGTGRVHDIEVVSSTCFDRAGAEIPGAEVELR